MNPIRRIRRLATVLAGLAAALAAFGVPPALAVRPPGPGAPGVTTPPGTITPPVEVHTVVVGGMPGWQIALIAVVARSEEHTSELQSLRHLVCRLLLEKKKNK